VRQQVRGKTEVVGDSATTLKHIFKDNPVYQTIKINESIKNTKIKSSALANKADD
jgi:hypothetical protein